MILPFLPARPLGLPAWSSFLFIAGAVVVPPFASWGITAMRRAFAYGALYVHVEQVTAQLDDAVATLETLTALLQQFTGSLPRVEIIDAVPDGDMAAFVLDDSGGMMHPDDRAIIVRRSNLEPLGSFIVAEIASPGRRYARPEAIYPSSRLWWTTVVNGARDISFSGANLSAIVVPMGGPGGEGSA